MPRIELLDQITIDKIAAGEVIERPASVVKELAENAIDAGASAVVVEIEDGGITKLRITDNGCGIAKSDVANAFLRHSTSKIRSAEDLSHISSLGFRGEALSSIAAVAQVELITKLREETFGTRYVIEGGKEKSLEDTGAPDGTTFLVRQLFYNTPARRKFLKTPMTEASHISDLLTRLALSHPEISFQFINNHQPKLHTSGNGKMKDVIYHIYGRDVANNLIPLEVEKGGLKISGYLGKPLISRGNRNFENYFVNGRYVKSSLLSKAIEDGYKDFSMQHRYPFVSLQLTVDQEKIDVNVHPTKMELRFSNQQEIYNLLYEAVREGLREPELIPEVELPEPPAPPENFAAPSVNSVAPPDSSCQAYDKNVQRTSSSPRYANTVREPSPAYGRTADTEAASGRGGNTSSRCQAYLSERPVDDNQEKNLDYFMAKMRERVTQYHNQITENAKDLKITESANSFEQNRREISEENASAIPNPSKTEENSVKNRAHSGNIEEKTEHTLEKTEPDLFLKALKKQKTEQALENSARKQENQVNDGRNVENQVKKSADPQQENQQLNLFEEHILKKEVRQEYKIIGQVFDTYWLVQFHDSLYIIDQHAAHERVLYERTLAGMKNRTYTSQYLSPPIILSLTMQEMDVLETYKDRFTSIGFEIEPFGGDEYAVRAIPDNLFGIAKKELLLEMLDEMADGLAGAVKPELIDEKVASMSCKAAVKGNSRLSVQEVDALIGELLSLENPYHCPHGRPTIIAMTKRELEKKFKRIV